MGSADRPLLRGVPAGVSDLRRVDAPYCLHPRWRRGEGGTGAHWVDCHAPRITPARGPSLWDDCDAPMGQDVDAVQEWDGGTGGTRLRHRSAHKLVNFKAAMMTRHGVCLRLCLWQIVQPKPCGAAGLIGRRLAKPGITACNVLVITGYDPNRRCDSWTHAVEIPIRSCSPGGQLKYVGCIEINARRSADGQRPRSDQW